MANDKHLQILRQGVQAWNEWRSGNPGVEPDLARSMLIGSDLNNAKLDRTCLESANLAESNLRCAQLGGADLYGANLRGAHLQSANLTDANLKSGNLTDARLTGSQLSGAELQGTVFGRTKLQGATGLADCKFSGPCTIDHRTVRRSGALPLAFLRGCGVPDVLIDFLPSLYEEQFESCFISCSTKDADFANTLRVDLQERGVRCWLAEHDIEGGKKLHEQVRDAINRYDRLLLILSQDSMESEWVATEIANARKRELSETTQMLFPIRLVDYERIKGWRCFDADTGIDSAKELREYFIPDFTNWTDDAAYEESLKRLLNALKADWSSSAPES